jgi:hypothetical protein
MPEMSLRSRNLLPLAPVPGLLTYWMGIPLEKLADFNDFSNRLHGEQKMGCFFVNGIDFDNSLSD